MLPHVNVISRFNLPLTFKSEIRKRSSIGDPPLGLAWLERRSDFFRNITLPSVMNQRYKNFSWYVMFHPETEKEFVNTLGNGFYPIYAASLEEGLDRIRVRMEQEFGADRRLYISVRLDTDDAISPEYLYKIAAFFNPALFDCLKSDRIALVFRRGLYRDIRTGKSIKKDYPNNPFSSLGEIVRAIDLKTIYATEHSNISKHFPTFSMESDVYDSTWTVSVHDSNIGNSFP